MARNTRQTLSSSKRKREGNRETITKETHREASLLACAINFDLKRWRQSRRLKQIAIRISDQKSSDN